MKKIVLMLFISICSIIILGQENKCFKGIGSSSKTKPALSIIFKNGIQLSVCGYKIKDVSKNEILISEFNVFNSNTQKSLAEYSATKTCRVKAKNDSLIITEITNLPIGKNWEMQPTPIKRQIIRAFEKDIVVEATKNVFQKIHIEQSKFDKFMNEIKSIDSKELQNDIFFYKFIKKLELLSLNGNEKTKDILFNFKKYFDIQLDGEHLEVLNEIKSRLKK